MSELIDEKEYLTYCQHPVYKQNGWISDDFQKYLTQGGNLKAVDESHKNWTGLHYASARGHYIVLHSMCHYNKEEVSKIVDAQDTDGKTALHVSALEKDYSNRSRSARARDELLRTGANLEAKDNAGNTPFHDACAMDNEEAVRELIGWGPNIDSKNNEGVSPLDIAREKGGEVLSVIMEWINEQFVLACGENDLEKAKDMLSKYGIEVNGRGRLGNTGLHVASEEGHTETVKFLLDSDAEANSTNHSGKTAFVLASAAGHEDIVKLLLDKGSDRKDEAFEAACESKNLGLMKLLLENGADVDKTDYDDRTCLHRACIAGSYEIVELLLDFGADMNKLDENDMSALILASWREHMDITKLLIERGVDEKEKGKALIFACEQDNIEVVKLMLEVGIDVNTPDKHGFTPLHYASFEGSRLEIMRLLLDHGADIDAKNSDDLTPLHKASVCENGNNGESVKMLLERGADITARNIWGETPQEYARRLNQMDMVKLIVAHQRKQEKGRGIEDRLKTIEERQDVLERKMDDILISIEKITSTLNIK